MKSLDKNGRIVSPYRTYNLILNKDYKFKDLGIEKDELKQLLDQHKGCQIKEFLNNLGKLYQKKKGLTDHIIAFKGSNIFQVRQLIKYIPDSKFLNIVRDVRGTFNSRKTAFNKSNKPFKNNVFLEAKKWNDGNANFYWLKRNHSGNTCEVFYENFVNKPDIELKKIGNHFNLMERENSNSVSYDLSKKAKETIHKNIDKSISDNSVQKWKDQLPVYEIRILEMFCHLHLYKRGYVSKRSLRSFFMFPLLYLLYYGFEIMRYLNKAFVKLRHND